MLLPMLTTQMFAQAPPAPPAVSGGAANHGASGDQPDPEGGTPLDGGLSILLLMGAAYGGKKIRAIRKK